MSHAQSDVTTIDENGLEGAHKGGAATPDDRP